MNLRTAELEPTTTARIAMRERLSAPGPALAWVSVIDRRRGDAVGRPAAASTAELAECRCPEFCERDHDND